MSIKNALETPDVVGCFSLRRIGAIAAPRDDFSLVAFAASVLRFVRAGSEPSVTEGVGPLTAACLIAEL